MTAEQASAPLGRAVDRLHLAPCTVQVSLRDADLPFARHTLPHQVRQLGRHAADVLVSLNRPAGTTPEPALAALLAELAVDIPQLRVVEVDHGAEAVAWVSRTFFGGDRFPLVDSKGTPVHAYLEPFRIIDQPFVAHLDSDMLLGGSGQRWLHEAIEVLRSDQGYLAAAPLAGPPAEDGRYASGGEVVDTVAGRGRRVSSFTGRINLVEVDRLLRVATPVPVVPPADRRRRLRARLTGLPDVDNLERLIGRRMLAAGLARIDLGGSGGLWALHPLHKTPSFVAALPDLIARVESGDVPDGQRGRYDLHPSLLTQDDIPRASARWRQLRRSLHPFRPRPGSWS